MSNDKSNASGLESRLKQLADEDVTESGAAILHSLWIEHKYWLKLVLSATSPIFASHSDHGPLHSMAIINNIEKLLGEKRISLLGATDIWMILECAFRHDIGMHVSNEDIEEYIKSPQFSIDVDDISKNGDSDLVEAAKALLYQMPFGLAIDISERASHLRTFNEKLNLVCQTKFRKEHAERSKTAARVKCIVPTNI